MGNNCHREIVLLIIIPVLTRSRNDSHTVHIDLVTFFIAFRSLIKLIPFITDNTDREFAFTRITS